MPATYKIPQNVDLEDKIIGPLTLKQFLYALAAGLITFVTFSSLYNTPLRALFYLIVTITWIFTAALVFVRPNEQNFSKFLVSFISFTTKPSRRVWRRIPSLKGISVADSREKPAPEPVQPSADEVRSRLQQLAHVVDTRGWGTEKDMAGRITSSHSAAPQLNVKLSASDEPEDILMSEDSADGSDRATKDLDRLLRQGVMKPKLAVSPPAPPVPPADPAPAQASAPQVDVPAPPKPAAPAMGELDLSSGDHEINPTAPPLQS